MSRELIVQRAGPALSLQDEGRPGWITYGLSRGGAMDRLALAEGAALLGQPPGTALEMGGMGGRFRYRYRAEGFNGHGRAPVHRLRWPRQ